MITENTPTVLTVFGASGDLAKLKLFPSIFNLHENKLLPDDFRLIGFSRKEFSNEEFRKIVEESIKKKFPEANQDLVNSLLNKVYYHTGNYDNVEDYMNLRKLIFSRHGSLRNLNYLSVPPFVFRTIIQNLADSREDRNEDMRLIIEKPFGEDEQSATDLFHFVNTHFSTNQIYLLDHYLGKLAVQSMLHMRRANRILNSMLQGSEISNIQITAFEEVGVEERIGYFDAVGIMKDFVHSHLLQILALVTMNIPTSRTGASLSREKYSILSALDYEAKPKDLVVGQYDTYCGHEGVSENSQTETFAAIKLGIDLEEWYNVPIYIRVGKKLKQKLTYVVIELEKYAFQEQYGVPSNKVVFKLQPDQQLIVKIYNQFTDGTMHEIDLGGELLCDNKSQTCDEKYLLTEYATLIKDVINGERLFFLDFSEVLASWKIMDQVISHKNSKDVKIVKYENGSFGPVEANEITKQDGFEWQEY
jgi:glucose-6-phosphate 1-dehydrogenase